MSRPCDRCSTGRHMACFAGTVADLPQALQGGHRRTDLASGDLRRRTSEPAPLHPALHGGSIDPRRPTRGDDWGLGL
eukprot:6889317-Pyramimonas_sp.AAC.1